MWTWLGWGAVAALAALTTYDLVQRKHAILRNFPLIGHLRYLLESVGPELRQYIVTNNDEERPFSRDERRWVYTSSKRLNNYFGFGSDNEMELAPNYLIIKHAAFPLDDVLPGHPLYDPRHPIPCAKVVGAFRGRAKAFRPESIVNLSAMSYGSLGARAVEAIDRGCALAGALHNTGEGGISEHHAHGAGLIWQLGTGYFGAREPDGRFSLSRLVDTVGTHPQVRAIEIKLSQGAKPGVGGMLPRAKITEEIARIRGVPRDRDCISPSSHAAFRDADGLLDFVERIAEATGLPVGIKSAVGDMGFWYDLAEGIETSGRAVDFVTVDGGEGGTGAAPLVFADHVSLPFKYGFSRVYRAFAERGVQHKVVFVGSGKLGFPEAALFAFASGCDLVAVAREAMLAIGCIQAQRCHTGHCPTGVATHNPWLVRGLDPADKARRLANYLETLRKEVLRLSRACGVPHPALVTPDHFEVLDGRYGADSVRDLFGYGDLPVRPSREDCREIERLMSESAERRA